MSNKITYQFSALPAEWVTDFNLSPAELRLLAFLILRSDEKGQSNVGYSSIGEHIGMCERQVRRMCDKLEVLRYIERTINHNRRLPTIIRVCFERIGRCAQNVGTDTHVRPEQNKTDIEVRPNKKQDGHFKQTGRTLNANRTDIEVPLNRTIEDFKNTRAGAREETETADVAAVRSMPDAGQAGENTRQGNQARFDLSDLNDCQYCLESIQGASDFSFLKSGKYLLFRPKGKFANVTDEIKNNITSFFSDKCGKMIFFIDAGVHYENEKKIV